MFRAYNHPSDISKEEMDQLPRASFSGHIYIVNTPAEARAAVQHLAQQEVLGIDTESKPNFVPGKNSIVSLVQISTMEECYLFRLKHMGLPDELCALFENPNIIKIGLNLRDDLVGLRRLKPFAPVGFVELQKLAPAYGLRCASLQKMYAILHGKYMSKKQRMTNWEARELSPAQQEYAALDAQASLAIYLSFMALPEPSPTQFGLIYDL